MEATEEPQQPDIENKKKKKKKISFSNIFHKSNDKPKQQKEKKKSVSEQSASTVEADINDIPLITGMTDGNTDEAGRKIGLSEKSEADRKVVKQILKDTIQQENKREMLLPF